MLSLAKGIFLLWILSFYRDSRLECKTFTSDRKDSGKAFERFWQIHLAYICRSYYARKYPLYSNRNLRNRLTCRGGFGSLYVFFQTAVKEVWCQLLFSLEGCCHSMNSLICLIQDIREWSDVTNSTRIELKYPFLHHLKVRLSQNDPPKHLYLELPLFG